MILALALPPVNRHRAPARWRNRSPTGALRLTPPLRREGRIVASDPQVLAGDCFTRRIAEADVSGTPPALQRRQPRRELEECWKSTLAQQSKPILRVDLTGVTFIDDAGKTCLAAMRGQGAKFVVADCATRDSVADPDPQAAL